MAVQQNQPTDKLPYCTTITHNTSDWAVAGWHAAVQLTSLLLSLSLQRECGQVVKLTFILIFNTKTEIILKLFQSFISDVRSCGG